MPIIPDHTPGPTAEAIEYIISTGAIGWGSETIGTDAGQAGGMTPPFPAHSLMHKSNRYGLASLCNLDSATAQGGNPDRRSVEDPERYGQPDAGSASFRSPSAAQCICDREMRRLSHG